MTPDVNVLVAAYLRDHPQHGQARRWLRETLVAAAGSGVALLPMVAVGFLRVVTSIRTSPVTSVAQAMTFLEFILGAPGVWMPEVGPEWSLFKALCLDRKLHGGIISDAWIAAAVRTHGLNLVTFDADFRQLLRPDQFTLLVAEPNLQERRAKYGVHGCSNRIDRKAA